jgi:hypothetical protein
MLIHLALQLSIKLTHVCHVFSEILLTRYEQQTKEKRQEIPKIFI